MKIKKCREVIASLLFPPRCPVCDDILQPEHQEEGIHIACRKKLYPVSGAVCMHCGRPFRKILRKNPRSEQDEYFDNNTKEYCEECKKRGYVSVPHRFVTDGRWSVPVSAVTAGKALYLYRGEIKQTMYRLKYSNKREYAQFFAKEAVRKYPKLFSSEGLDAIVPVPMYLPKQRKRGYNQAECLARRLSELTGSPVANNLICRVKDTTPQKELNDVERKNNLKNAFQNGKSIVKYKKVLVVDDIYTTGSTVEAVAEQLKCIGIHQVYVLSICIGGEM